MLLKYSSQGGDYGVSEALVRKRVGCVHTESGFGAWRSPFFGQESFSATEKVALKLISERGHEYRDRGIFWVHSFGS